MDLSFQDIAKSIKGRPEFTSYSLGTFEYNGLACTFYTNPSKIKIQIDLASINCTCDDIVSCDCDDIDIPTQEVIYTKKQFEKLNR